MPNLSKFLASTSQTAGLAMDHAVWERVVHINFNNNYVTPEYIALGFLSLVDCEAVKILEGRGISYASFSSGVFKGYSGPAIPAYRGLPRDSWDVAEFTTEFYEVLDHAERNARDRKTNRVRTSDLLVGLALEPMNKFGGLLFDLNIEPDWLEKMSKNPPVTEP